MEGGVTVILMLFIVVGGIAGAVALFGAGGYVQRRKEKGELGGSSGEQERPRHTAVEDDSSDVLVPSRTTKDTQGPE